MPKIIPENHSYTVTEEKFLHQIHLEEQFGSSTRPDVLKDKKRSSNNAAIGYNYETDEPIPESAKAPESITTDDKQDDEDSDIDLGLNTSLSSDNLKV